MSKIFDENDRLLVSSIDWYLPNLIRYLKEQDNCYTYYRGKKITSDMSEDEIYTITYGSKEAFTKKYPNGYSQESLEVARDELLYAFVSVASPIVAKVHLENIKKEGKSSLDYDVGEYVLALAGGAPCKDIYALMDDKFTSGFSRRWIISNIASCSLRGDEFLEYYKEIDPEGYKLYCPKGNNTNSDTER